MLSQKQEKGFISTTKISPTQKTIRIKPSKKAWAKDYLKKIAMFLINKNRPIVMCVPRGGLNDMLCQIHHCRQYARAHGRVLIVNSTKSGMRDAFSNYFETWLPDPMLCLNAKSTSWAKPGNKDCFPLELCGRAYSYTSAFSKQLNFYDEKTGTPLRFNTSQAYSQKPLIHEQCGGGSDGWKALENLRLTSDIRSKVLSKLQNLPTSYISVHIRHSDVTTNYVKFFDLISADIRDSIVLVCSDSYQVLSHAKKVLPAHQVITISDIPDNGGMPLHDHASHTTKQTNIDLLIDLFSLALASTLMTPSPEIGYPSGFAELARQLMLRPGLICQLLGTIPKQLENDVVTKDVRTKG